MKTSSISENFPASLQKQREKRRWVALIVVSLTLFLETADGSMLSSAFDCHRTIPHKKRFEIF